MVHTMVLKDKPQDKVKEANLEIVEIKKTAKMKCNTKSRIIISERRINISGN